MKTKNTGVEWLLGITLVGIIFGLIILFVAFAIGFSSVPQPQDVLSISVAITIGASLLGIGVFTWLLYLVVIALIKGMEDAVASLKAENE